MPSKDPAEQGLWMFQRRRSAVALRHVAFEDLGLLAPIMEREGWNVSFCEAPVDDLSHFSIRDADLLIVLGGPIGVYETDSFRSLQEKLISWSDGLRRACRPSASASARS